MHEAPRNPTSFTRGSITDGYEIRRVVDATQDGPPERRLEVTIEPLSPLGRRVCVIGEVDVATAQTLEQRMIEEIDRTGAVLLDLSEVSFIDSTGLAAIIAVIRHARHRGTRLSLVHQLSPQPWRLFEMTGVLHLLGLQ